MCDKRMLGCRASLRLCWCWASCIQIHCCFDEGATDWGQGFFIVFWAPRARVCERECSCVYNVKPCFPTEWWQSFACLGCIFESAWSPCSRESEVDLRMELSQEKDVKFPLFCGSLGLSRDIPSCSSFPFVKVIAVVNSWLVSGKVSLCWLGDWKFQMFWCCGILEMWLDVE
jgi:hypothetical protein